MDKFIEDLREILLLKAKYWKFRSPKTDLTLAMEMALLEIESAISLALKKNE